MPWRHRAGSRGSDCSSCFMWFALKKILSALLLPPVSSILLALVGLWIARYHRRTGITVVVLPVLVLVVEFMVSFQKTGFKSLAIRPP